jgi:hypothetical protein
MFIILCYSLIFLPIVTSQMSSSDDLRRLTIVDHRLHRDICQTIQCGTGLCVETKNPILPYYCQCPNGSNTILPCSSESSSLAELDLVKIPIHLDPCSSSPCGSGNCEPISTLPNGYLCRCASGHLSLDACNGTDRCNPLISFRFVL